MQIDQEKLDTAVRGYLDSRPYVLWANWDLPNQRKNDYTDAYDWLKEQVNEVLSRVPDEEDDGKCGVPTCTCCYDPDVEEE